jgi:hypothetical protein
VGTIIWHVGIPKAGSSSIQHWLGANAATLRDTRDTCLMVVRNRREPGDTQNRLWVDEYEDGGSNSGAFGRAYYAFGRSARSIDRLMSGVTAIANRYATSVITSEGFAQLLVRDGGDAQFLAALDELATAHVVRVAYYFRPQDACLEAMWRQWGFRLPSSPSEYVVEAADELHYGRTAATVARLAPHVHFEPRPFRPDLLVEASPVVDFAHHFLDAADLARRARNTHTNAGLPLALVNVLRFAPEDIIGRDAHDAAALERLKRLFGNVELPDDPKLDRSRLVLRAYCHERFEPENAELLASLGVTGTEFVPAAAGVPADIGALDDLWSSDASPAERALLYDAVRAALR